MAPGACSLFQAVPDAKSVCAAHLRRPIRSPSAHGQRQSLGTAAGDEQPNLAHPLDACRLHADATFVFLAYRRARSSQDASRSTTGSYDASTAPGSDLGRPEGRPIGRSLSAPCVVEYSSCHSDLVSASNGTGLWGQRGNKGTDGEGNNGRNVGDSAPEVCVLPGLTHRIHSSYLRGAHRGQPHNLDAHDGASRTYLKLPEPGLSEPPVWQRIGHQRPGRS